MEAVIIIVIAFVIGFLIGMAAGWYVTLIRGWKLTQPEDSTKWRKPRW